MAPITKTAFLRLHWQVSNSVNNWETILKRTNSVFIQKSCLSITPPASLLLPLFGANESSSSKKSTAGAIWRALANSSRTFLSLSPTYWLSSSGPLTEWKARPNSFATAESFLCFSAKFFHFHCLLPTMFSHIPAGHTTKSRFACAFEKCVYLIDHHHHAVQLVQSAGLNRNFEFPF